MAAFTPLIILLYSLNIFQLVHAVNPVVDLKYAKYKGFTSSSGVTQWLGMRYAAPPVGDLRFAAPEDPRKETKQQPADEHGPKCLTTGASPDKKGTSEDCLFIDVYAPTKATPSSKLPVFFYIQGGGFNSNAGANYNGTGLIKASDMDMVVVNFNYRVGPYGFLASKEVKKGGAINNGLRDQIKALSWVQQHISKFGGDPGHVTIGGNSAGAASVYYLLTAFGGEGVPMFHAAAAGSPSFGTQLTVKESQYMYDTLVSRTKCKGKNSLACLRKLDIKTLQKHNKDSPLPGAKGTPLYMYSPTIDGDIIHDITYRLLGAGRFKRVPTIFGADTNEGTLFCPKGTDTLAQSDTFLKNQFPKLTKKHFNKIHELFPKTKERFEGKGPYWRQCANAYGTMRYTCPAIALSVSYKQAYDPTKVWNYHYAVEDRPSMLAGNGVAHTAEIPAIWGPTYVGGPKSYKPGGKNAGIVPIVQGYFTSFIRSFDPNKHRAKGSPEWETLGKDKGDKNLRRLKIKTGATKMESVDKVQSKQCEYLISIGDDLRMR
ncbi:hypothetical protein FQN52_008912 [Onygenales sp. PD_12]|nr:hypothetical protein FQN52_008912 [Onygenales sp. PD_12]